MLSIICYALFTPLNLYFFSAVAGFRTAAVLGLKRSIQAKFNGPSNDGIDLQRLAIRCYFLN